MTAKARFEITALIVCAIGVIVIVSGVWGSSGGSEPRRFPQHVVNAKRVDASNLAERTADASTTGTTLPSSMPIDCSVRAVSHNVMVPAQIASIALGQADLPTNVSLEFTDVDNQSQKRGVTADAEILACPKDSIILSGTMPDSFREEHDSVVVVIDGTDHYSVKPGRRTFSVQIPKLPDKTHTIRIGAIDATNATVAGIGRFSFQLKIRTTRVRVLDVDASGLRFSAPPYRLKVTFDTADLERTSLSKNTFALQRVTDAGGVVSPGVTLDVESMGASASVELVIHAALDAALYRLRIIGGPGGVKDLFGNLLQGNDASQENFDENILKPIGTAIPSIVRGIPGATGPYVPFPEFTHPRNVPDGFNPNDKVESRVVRLYYYRDAHRVAQIINRKVRSHNRAGVDMQRQLADKARTEADQRTIARQQAERHAIIQAQKLREQEHQLAATEQALRRSVEELTNYRRANPQADPQMDATLQRLSSVAESFQNRARDARAQVQVLRDEAVRASEQVQRAEAEERLSREEQFRREVAAAHADPDTYAPGVPKSDDPVEQVSVSVIGEGLIHLRGPLKGINVIRTMIDQIDQPVGQVRVSVHTVQINGERQERMEDVANIIQRYIDHARFLTMQSSEMLRQAVVLVASRKAEEAMALYPGESQEDRDRRYLYAFFGQDFIHELETMDSEFLRTGNKLLSLHSMDTTSLSSALNLMALAKNTTRLEIFEEFYQMVHGQLPSAEASYLEAGLTAMRKRRLSLRHPPRFYPMAQNAKFESLRGFFNMEIAHEDTMTPLQREFVRLAQIFKSRLITEMEYKQRVMERGVIEERLGNRLQDLRDAQKKEDTAREALSAVETELRKQQLNVVRQTNLLVAEAEAIEQEVQAGAKNARDYATRLEAVAWNVSNPYQTNLQNMRGGTPQMRAIASKLDEVLGSQRTELARLVKPGESVDFVARLRKLDEEMVRTLNTQFHELRMPAPEGEVLQIPLQPEPFHGVVSFETWRFSYKLDIARNEVTVTDGAAAIADSLGQAKKQAAATLDAVSARFAIGTQGKTDLEFGRTLLAAVAPSNPSQVFDNLLRLRTVFHLIEQIYAPIQTRIENILERLNKICAALSCRDVDVKGAYANWVSIRREVLPNTQGDLRTQAETILSQGSRQFEQLLESRLKLDFSVEKAQESRRPLDHKKFLDMLIDDLEDKYIELLDGTRAHTANVDNYLKRLTTALDDDFNTQFYHPAFRYIREASTHWDVQFGQTETTSILANNREFAKVDPSATMEFDLPARDILLAEALNGAKAMMDDVGALANDPTFLAMAKMRTQGSGASPPPGSTGGFGVVRDVLPGLNSSTAEQVMAHNAGARPQLGSNLENLIPDPAIYKFETGTGFEIRPVIQPDGQAVVFNFNYMYSTNIREPVRADEKHLGRVRRHYIDTDVQLSNFELREVSRYTVALKAARTSRGVPLLEDIPLVGSLWRPLPSSESSLQQNIIMSQATIFPTLFDLMGLRWAPVVSDMDPLRVTNREFIARSRHRALENRVYDYASSQVDEFLRIPEANRRTDLYRSQETIPSIHPNGYQGPGLDLRDGQLQEGYQPERAYPSSRFIPGESREGSPLRPGRNYGSPPGTRIESYPLEQVVPRRRDPEPIIEPANR